MIAKMYFDIARLKFEGKGLVDINDGTVILSNDSKTFPNYCNSTLLQEYGQSINRHPDNSRVFALAEFKLSGEGIIAPDKFHDDYLKEFSRRSEHLKSFLIFLWFVQDNSVGLYGTYGHIPEMKIVNGKSRSLVSYMSDGSSNEVVFSKQQLVEASDWTILYSKITGYKYDADFNTSIIYDYNQPNVSAKGVVLKTNIDFNYNDITAIDRALHFLSIARGHNLLFYKIAFYMPVIECLFGTKGNDLTYRVSLWAACYLTDIPEERESARKDFITAYNIRSRFIHGQAVDSDITNDKLAPLSVRIDKHIRTILKKAIKYDSIIFNKYKTEQREAYCNSLVLGNEFDHATILNIIHKTEEQRNATAERELRKQQKAEAMRPKKK